MYEVNRVKIGYTYGKSSAKKEQSSNRRKRIWKEYTARIRCYFCSCVGIVERSLLLSLSPLVKSSRLCVERRMPCAGCGAVAPGYSYLHRCRAPPHRKRGARICAVFHPLSLPGPIINFDAGAGAGAEAEAMTDQRLYETSLPLFSYCRAPWSMPRKCLNYIVDLPQ